MDVNKEKINKKRSFKFLPKIKEDHYHKLYSEINKEKDILLYKKYSTNLNSEKSLKNKEKKKFRVMSVGILDKIINKSNEKDICNSNEKLKKFNNNGFLEKKYSIEELSKRKKMFSQKVKLIKLFKRDQSPKKREETSFELIRRYSSKILLINRFAINMKKEKIKEIFEKLETNPKPNLKKLNNNESKILPPLIKVNFSTNNGHVDDYKEYISRNNKNFKIGQTNKQIINRRYLMLQYSNLISQQNQERIQSSLNIGLDFNISNDVSMNQNQPNINNKIIKAENEQNKEQINDYKIHKLKTEFTFKEYNYLNYAIVPGNASYLVKNCMNHRTNWIESFSNVTNMFNFKWQQNTKGINYSRLGSYGNIRQVINHFENHFAISNKANMFINLMFYCEQRKISVFKYVPLTIIFDLDVLDNYQEITCKKKEIEKLKKIVEKNSSKFIKKYNEIGKYFQEEKFRMNYKERIEYIKRTKKNGFNEFFIHFNEDEKSKNKNESFKSIYPIYIDYFGKPELIEKVSTNISSNYDCYIKIRNLEKEMEENFAMKTVIEIPETHSIGKNMWIIKAINLCQGKCMQIAHNFNQMLIILNKFKEGVKFNFTEKVIEEKKEEINRSHEKNGKRIDKDLSSLYCCDKIIIQKYIERPLLYKGRKCDMRIWVLLTHNMKVYFFKEGHLKTCSIPYDIESKDAYSHITNYSFQKHNINFQKYEKGNEVPFYDFQKFLDETYPEKNYKIKNNLYKQIKEIVSISMMSVKYQINKNNRNYQFEIFGYDFMLDADFNLFLIEINDDPGIEESSPWISIIIPRMLDDALRLTIDQIFNPVYDFTKNYKKNKNKDEDKFKKISENFRKEIKNQGKFIKTENNIHKNTQNQENKNERILTENNINSNQLKNSKEIENIHKTKYVSPFRVPGYKNDENLWEFVCNLNEDDPLDIYLDKKKCSEKSKFLPGIKYLFSKRKT